MSPLHKQLVAHTILVLGLVCWKPLAADVLELQPDHPDRYTVVEGDTLWDIASRFLKSPWHWPKIWKINEQVENPHLIYPGDVILLRWVNGKPELSVLRQEKITPTETPGETPEEPPITEPPVARPRHILGNRERVLPTVRVSPRRAPIPTISPDAIGPFLTRPLIVDRRELEKAGYITVGLDGRRVLGNTSEFYARGIKDPSHEFYFLFRKGRAIRNPGNGRFLGYEAIYVGDARMLIPGHSGPKGVHKMVLTKVTREVEPTDRLLPVTDVAPIPIYYPRSPENKVRGAIVLARQAVTEVGPMNIVIVNLGAHDDMQEGHVLQVWHNAGTHRDPVVNRRYKIPEDKSGLVMLFKIFDKVSYGLVMKTTRPVHIFDTVTTP